MPSNSDFTLEVLIGGLAVPEYEKRGKRYVECNLNTPLTYKEKATEVVSGSTETQEYPVTPYQIRVTAHISGTNPHYFRILVDGIKVKSISLEAGQSRVIKGFRDGPWLRELLFSMPRFAKDETDRLTPERKRSIGRIEVECWSASLKTRKLGLRFKELDFQQANKKDSSTVTSGKYIMATSRAGKRVASRSLIRSVDSWKLEDRLSTLSLQYHMSHTLVEMGITLRPMDFSLMPARRPRGPHSDVKQEIKEESGFTGGRREFTRKRRHRERRETSEDVVAALLSLRGTEMLLSRERAALVAQQKQHGGNEEPMPSTSTGHSSSVGHSARSAMDRSKDSSKVITEHCIIHDESDVDINDAFEDWEDGLEILQVIKSGTSSMKKPKIEPALIDLTSLDSDSEDLPHDIGNRELIKFQGITKVKAEEPEVASAASGSVDIPLSRDSGISSTISQSITQEETIIQTGVDSVVNLECNNIVLHYPGDCVAMETVVESCETSPGNKDVSSESIDQPSTDVSDSGHHSLAEAFETANIKTSDTSMSDKDQAVSHASISEYDREQSNTSLSENDKEHVNPSTNENDKEQAITSVSENDKEQAITSVSENDKEQAIAPVSESDKEQAITPVSESDKEQAITPVSESDKEQAIAPVSENDKEQAITPVSESDKEQAITFMSKKF